MAHEVRLTARALADIGQTLDWLTPQSPQAAAKWRRVLETRLQSLQDQPERYALADEAKDLGIELRELLFGRRKAVYRILFTTEGNVVNVLHIRRASRDVLRPEDL
jgi:plasmid stabilization system protein ParE